MPPRLPFHHLLSKPKTLISTITTVVTPTSNLAVYLRRAREIDTLRLNLRHHPPSPTDDHHSSPLLTDSFVAVQSLRCCPSPDAAISLFRSLPTQNNQTIHAFAKILALSRRTSELHSLLSDVDTNSFSDAILPPSPLDRLRWFSAASDVEASLRSFAVLRSQARRGRPSTEAYNLLIKVYIENEMNEDAVSLFESMVEEGVLPNARSYTVVIQHLVKLGRFEDAVKVFERLPLMRVKRTTKQYDLLSEAFSSNGQYDKIKKLIDEMRCEGMLPGKNMRDAMVKMRDAGWIEAIQDFSQELDPDYRIGCVAESSSDEDNDEDGDRNERRKMIKLKPWLDPNALASALKDWDVESVNELERVGFVWTSRLVCKLLRGFSKAETAWKFFTWVARNQASTGQSKYFIHDKHTVSRMITILARNGSDELVEKLIHKVKTEGISLPFTTLRLIIDFYGISKRAEAALKIFSQVDSICDPISDSNRALLMSSLLRTLAKCKYTAKIIEILDNIMSKSDNIDLPDIQTFSGLMQYFAWEGDLERVATLFGMVRRRGLEPDGYMYQVLIRAYIKLGRAALALRSFEDMMNSNLVLDGPTKTLLVNSLWSDGRRREVADVEERCEQVGAQLPVALPGHVWTVSSADLIWICKLYRNKGST